MTSAEPIEELKTLHAARHVTLLSRGRWEYVERNVQRPAVGIVALTPADGMLLVEQYRPPVTKNVVELPAGLAGDIAGQEDEPLLEAAKRELLEETGYTSDRWTRLGVGYSSPGLTSEEIELFLALDVHQVSEGGGDDGEQITVHIVPRKNVVAWLSQRDLSADLKLIAGLYLAERFLGTGEVL